MNAKFAAISLAAALVALTALPASAENACKGLSEQACGDSAACGWTKGYTRKDGREVAPYCRAKPAPKPTAEAAGKPVPAAG